MSAEIMVQYVMDFLALLAILAGAYYWWLITKIPAATEDAESGETLRTIAASATRAAGFTALGLVLLVTGKLVGVFAGLS